jgi:hypothetical protein
MLMMLTSDRAGALGESDGSSVGKGGESDVESWHLQDCSLHLCQLSIDGLAAMRKYWMYWSHVGDMGPVNQCSMFVNRCLTFITACSMFVNRCLAFITASMAIRGEKLDGRPADRSAGMLGLPRMGAVGSIQLFWVNMKGCPYGYCPEEVYMWRTWTSTRSVCVMCIMFPLQDVHWFKSPWLSDMSNRLSCGHQHIAKI